MFMHHNPICKCLLCPCNINFGFRRLHNQTKTLSSNEEPSHWRSSIFFFWLYTRLIMHTLFSWLYTSYYAYPCVRFQIRVCAVLLLSNSPLQNLHCLLFFFFLGMFKWFKAFQNVRGLFSFEHFWRIVFT